MGHQVILENVAITWPALFAPKTSKAFPNNPPTFSATAVLVPGTHDAIIGKVKAAMDEVNAELFADNPREYPKFWRMPKANGNIELRASAGADQKPALADAKAQPITVDQGQFYAGAICNVFIDVYGTTNHGGKICFGLLGVQKVRDGERIDGRPTHDDLFKPIAVTGNAPDPLG